MKVGDVVMFTDTGTYAKWFFGRLGVIERYTPGELFGNSTGSCRVRWMNPVPYHDKMTTVSDFSIDKFETANENR